MANRFKVTTTSDCNPMDADKKEMNIGLTLQNTQLIQLIHTLSKTMTPQQINQHMETLLIIGHMCTEMGKQELTCSSYAGLQ